VAAARTPTARVRLNSIVFVNRGATDRPDCEALNRALTHPPQERWTGIVVDDADPVDHLDVWLLAPWTRGRRAGRRLTRCGESCA
jgi:protein-L-isoaspartate(D-aspartate) O-methyltransferase